MKKIAVLFLLCLNVLMVLGQTEARQPTSDWELVFFTKPEIALPLLQEAAVKRSASLEAMETEKSILKEDLQIAKKNILTSVAVTANYNYGNVGNFTVLDGTQVNLSTTRSALYNAGVGVSLPLDRVINRHNQINRQQLLYKQAESMRKSKEDEIRQQIIRLYQEVVLSHNLLNTYQEARQTALLNNQLAEKQFTKGELNLAEYSRINDLYNRAVSEQETLSAKYKTDFWLLEEAVGKKISALMITK